MDTREAADSFVEAVAQRAAELVLEQLQDTMVAERETAPASPWMTVSEAAELRRAKPQRVYDLLSAGKLSRFKEGSRTLVSCAEVMRLVAADRVAPALPTERRLRLVERAQAERRSKR